MKNIFVEGIQGSGKTTLVNQISKRFPDLHICREGDYSPTELAWCTWMSKQEYDGVLKKYSPIKEEIEKHTVKEQDHYIISYTKILTDIPGFHKDLENYEIYNGRKTLSELKEIVMTRFHNFTQSGYLFECSFFQNIMEDLMLFHVLNDEEIINFYRDLFQVINTENFLLLYLYADHLEENIKIIKKERSDDAGNELWYQMMLEYLIQSPYGQKNGCRTFDDLINHLKHRQELELLIINEIIKEKAIVLSAKEYDMDQIEALVTMPNQSAYKVREMKKNEYSLLDSFLYEAIFIPEGVKPPEREIIQLQELQVYVKDFGAQEGDMCFVAEVEDKVVGAVWVRIMDDYGHVEEGVPSFAISLYKDYRGRGIGTDLMKRMLAELKIRGYEKASLAVQKANYAAKMYQNLGFEIVNENAEEYIMVYVINRCE